MNDKLKEVVNAIAISLKIDPTQLLETVKNEEDGVDLTKLQSAIDGSIENTITHVKDQAKEAQKNLLKMAIAKRMGEIEDKLRGPLGIDSEKKGDDLIDAALEAVKGLQDASLSEDKVKTHPLYIQAVNDATDRGREEYKEKYETLKGEFDGYKSEQEYGKVWSVVKDLAVEKFSKANIIDAANEDARKNMLRNLLRDLGDAKYTLDEHGKPLLVNDEGQPLKDERGNLIQFDSKLEKAFTANVLTKPGKPKDTPGGGGGGPTGGYTFSEGYKGPQVPDNKEEAYKLSAELMEGIATKKVSMETVAEYGKALEAKFSTVE